jgi:hypothetical protein
MYTSQSTPLYYLLIIAKPRQTCFLLINQSASATPTPNTARRSYVPPAALPTWHPCLNESQHTTAAAAQDVAAFLAILSNSFSEFGSKPFHIAGESYGVRLLSAICSCRSHADGIARRVDTSPRSLLRYTTSTRTSACTT